MRVTAEDLAQNPRLRKAVTAALARAAAPRATPPARSFTSTLSSAEGRAGNRYRCHTCGQTFDAWAAVERHADTHGGARIELAP